MTVTATVWWRVTLPMLGPGLLSGSVLAFARALGEFGATLTFAVGLSSMAVAHNTAHDTRHAIGFPCH